MKLERLITATAVGIALTAGAQNAILPERFSPLAEGYIERARAFRADANYAGVIDQLDIVATRGIKLTPELAGECMYMLAEAYYERGSEECLALLFDFRRDYPASPLAPEAAMAIGDFYFFRHDWPDALEAYNDVDDARLNRDRSLLLRYRKTLSLIKTGHYQEARPLLRELGENSAYSTAANFYTAYLDYIDGDFNSAYDRFERVPEGEKGLEAAYYMAQIEYTRSQYGKVISRGVKLLKSDPVAELVPETQRIVGLSYFKEGHNDAAARYLDAYLKAAENPAPDALYASGAIAYAGGDYDLAASRFSKVSGINSEIGQGALLYLGQCYLHSDNPSAAAMAFEKAAKMNIDNRVTESALYNYAAAVTRGGNVPFSSSAGLLEDFVKRYPKSDFAPKVESYLAAAYFNEHNYQRALQAVNAIPSPDSKELQLKQKILFELGTEALANGRAADAERHLAAAASMKRQDSRLAAQSSLWLGDAQYALGKFGDAARSYQNFLDAAPRSENTALALYDLAYARYKLGRYAAAAEAFSKALATKRNPLSQRMADDATIRCADCYYYTGNYSEASALFTRAISAGAADTDYALYRRAVIRGLTGDNKGKIADLTLIENKFPDSRWMQKTLAELADVYQVTGQSDLAADTYKKRIGTGAEIDIDELFRMAAAMHSAGRWDDVIEVTERIRHADDLTADELADIDLYAADALAAKGRGAEAEEIYRRLAATPASLPGAKAAVALGELLLKNKRYEEAEQLMTDFTDAGTPHEYWLARGFIVLADVYTAQGKGYLAKEYLISLRDNYPGDESDIKQMISSRLKKLK